jgi:hypothetical protein
MKGAKILQGKSKFVISLLLIVFPFIIAGCSGYPGDDEYVQKSSGF